VADARPTGRCPVCGKVARLDVAGRLVPHAAPLLHWLDCDGAGYLPRKAAARG